MDNLKSVSSLLAERKGLYGKLLQCSRAQLGLFERLRSEEELPVEFLELQDQWESTASDINKIQKRLEETVQEKDIQDSELVEVMQECIENMSLLQQKLASYKESLGGDFQNIRDQRTLMNAYYGITRKTPISFYFDEKN
ncbi:hypothetical protein [Paenibacillus sp. A14]|uniref:hypothetical protein n=1 Tax=Paenibacillus sp. A14 TaxID=3119820 RepID=UPI002FDF53FC